MASSRVPALRSALKTAIAAQLVTDAVTADCTEFDPGDEQTKTDAVWIGAIRSLQEEHTFGGSREETLNAEVFIRVLKPGAGDTVAAAAEDAAHTILASIETTLRDDPTLSTTLFDCVLAGHEAGYATTPEGRMSIIAADIEATAHI